MRAVNLPQITAEQAENEPAADRIQFPPTRAYPQNRATITAVYDGFHVQFELFDTGVGKVEQFIGTLQERGYTPAPVAAPARQQNGTPAAATNGHAHCPDHPDRTLKPMKFADKAGHTLMCTARRDDGEYCLFRA